MSLQLVTPPAIEPVTLDEAKAHLKVDVSDDDTLIASLIAAARARAEWHTGRAFITQSWLYARDGWPCAPFELPLPPLQSVTSITVTDTADNATVLDASLYRVDTGANPARIAWKESTLPPTNLRNLNALEVAFTAGYGDAAADVPEAIRAAILAIVADLYLHRGDDAPTPDAALMLLAPYRVQQF